MVDTGLTIDATEGSPYLAVDGTRGRINFALQDYDTQQVWDLYNTGMGGWAILAISQGYDKAKFCMSPTDPGEWRIVPTILLDSASRDCVAIRIL